MKRSFVVFLSSLFALLSYVPSVNAQTKFTPNIAHSAQVQKKPLGAVVRPMATGTTGPNTTIDFNWVNGSNPNVPPCTTATVNCVVGDTLTDTTAGIVLASDSQLPISTLDYTYTPTGGLYFGTHTFSLVTNYFDGSGTAQVTAAATASVTNSLTSLNGPVSLTGIAAQ